MAAPLAYPFLDGILGGVAAASIGHLRNENLQYDFRRQMARDTRAVQNSNLRPIQMAYTRRAAPAPFRRGNARRAPRRFQPAKRRVQRIHRPFKRKGVVVACKKGFNIQGPDHDDIMSHLCGQQ